MSYYAFFFLFKKTRTFVNNHSGPDTAGTKLNFRLCRWTLGVVVWRIIVVSVRRICAPTGRRHECNWWTADNAYLHSHLVGPKPFAVDPRREMVVKKKNRPQARLRGGRTASRVCALSVHLRLTASGSPSKVGSGRRADAFPHTCFWRGRRFHLNCENTSDRSTCQEHESYAVVFVTSAVRAVPSVSRRVFGVFDKNKKRRGLLGRWRENRIVTPSHGTTNYVRLQNLLTIARAHAVNASLRPRIRDRTVFMTRRRAGPDREYLWPRAKYNMRGARFE